MLSRSILLLVSGLLLLPACSDDDAPSDPSGVGGTAGAAGQSAAGSAGAAGQNEAGSAGMAGMSGGAGAGGDTPASGTLTATLDGKEVPAEGEPYVALQLSSTKLFIARGKSNTDPYIEMVFQNNAGFSKPLVLPPASKGTERQAHIYMAGAEYWASRQGSDPDVEDKLQVVDGRLKGSWTYTSKAWGNGSGDAHTVVITADLPLPKELQ